MSLPVDGDVFLIGMVSRMTDQKGFDLIAYIMDELLSTERVQFVVAEPERHDIRICCLTLRENIRIR